MTAPQIAYVGFHAVLALGVLAFLAVLTFKVSRWKNAGECECACCCGQVLELSTGTQLCVGDRVRVVLTGQVGEVREIRINKHQTAYEVRTPYYGEALTEVWHFAEDLELVAEHEPEHWSDGRDADDVMADRASEAQALADCQGMRAAG